MNGTSATTWGTALNQMGGGTVAMQRDFSQGGPGIRVWFWDKGKEPSDVKTPGKTVSPDNWGTPAADFGLTQCADQFGPHNIIFDITLCGSWAGAAVRDASHVSIPRRLARLILRAAATRSDTWAIPYVTCLTAVQ